MKYLIKKDIGLIVLSVNIFCVLIASACNSQNEDSQLTIPPLKQIKTIAQKHYKTLSEYSTEVNKHRKHLDTISFPKKVHQLTIKVISPAYLSREEINRLIYELNPPANSSDQTRAELDFLLELQTNRTPAQISEALRIHEITYFPFIGMRNKDHLFFEVYEVFNNQNNQFNVSDYPKTEQLLHNLMKEMRIAEFTAKNHFLRARPRQLEPNLQPLKQMKSASYASGHTLWAYLQAYVLAELIPEKRNEFIELAYQIGFSREVLGVHYPSDEEASRKLAHKLLEHIWIKPKFIKDFNEAQKEW